MNPVRIAEYWPNFRIDVVLVVARKRAVEGERRERMLPTPNDATRLPTNAVEQHSHEANCSTWNACSGVHTILTYSFERSWLSS